MTPAPAYRSPFALLPVIGIPVFLAIANQTMVSVALPDIGADLGEIRRLPWLVIGYLIAVTIAGPLYGVLGDTFGRARMLQTALAIYILGTLACAAASGLTMLVAGRVLQGMGGGGLMALSQALIGDVVAPRDRGRAQGNIAAISVLASTSGPLVGGIMVEALGWRSMFLVTLVPALLAMVLLARLKMPKSAPRSRQFDFGGLVALMALVLGVTAAIELAGAPATRALAVASGALGLAGLAGLLFTQRRATNALFPPALFAVPAITRASAMTFLHGAALVSLVTMIPLFHAILRADGAFLTATTMLTLTVGFGVAGVITGNLISWTGRTLLFPSLSLPVAVVGLVFLAWAGADLGRPALIATYMVIGLSIGSVMSVMNTVVQVATPDAVRGRAAGSVTFFRSIGAVVGTALTSFVLFAFSPQVAGSGGAVLTLAQSVDPAAIDGWRLAFRAAFLTIAGFVVLEWVAGLLNPLRRVE